jgi:hypothetical protein
MQAASRSPLVLGLRFRRDTTRGAAKERGTNRQVEVQWPGGRVVYGET